MGVAGTEGLSHAISLLQDYGGVESDCQPMTERSPGEIQAHIISSTP